MKDATFLIWLAVIAIGSQLIAVFVMWQLQQIARRDDWKRRQGEELSPADRLQRVEEESRAATEAALGVMQAAQAATIRDEVRRAVGDRRDRG